MFAARSFAPSSSGCTSPCDAECVVVGDLVCHPGGDAVRLGVSTDQARAIST
jgi:hypothetical protein